MARVDDAAAAVAKAVALGGFEPPTRLAVDARRPHALAPSTRGEVCVRRVRGGLALAGHDSRGGPMLR